jgi:hypothetical protein
MDARLLTASHTIKVKAFSLKLDATSEGSLSLQILRSINPFAGQGECSRSNPVIGD